MTDIRHRNTAVNIFFTLCRAVIILISGIYIGSNLLSFLPSNAASYSGKNIESNSELKSAIEVEKALQKHLNKQKADIADKISKFACAGTSATQTSSAQKATGKSDIRHVRDIARYSVVYIETSSGSSGTGFFVTKDTIVTNAHVVGNDSEVMIYSPETYPKPTKAIVASSTGVKSEMGSRDFAILKVPSSGKSVPLTFTNEAGELDPVVSAGYPGIFQKLHSSSLPKLILRQGEYISKLPQANGAFVIAHSAEVFPGNSGGPLLNFCGEVVGINTMIVFQAISGDKNHQNKTDFALPSNDILDYLKSNGVNAKVTTQPC